MLNLFLHLALINTERKTLKQVQGDGFSSLLSADHVMLNLFQHLALYNRP